MLPLRSTMLMQFVQKAHVPIHQANGTVQLSVSSYRLAVT